MPALRLMLMLMLVLMLKARDVDESRFLYDQLAVLSPVMLALTAATPILRGRLVETDVRWDTIVNAVDDRTPAERGLLDADPVRSGIRFPPLVMNQSWMPVLQRSFSILIGDLRTRACS